MLTYRRIKTENSFRYSKQSDEGRAIFVSKDRLPQEVVDKFNIDESIQQVKFDDQPDVPRCLFCDAPRTKRRTCNGVWVELCDPHYYSVNLGRIAQQLRINKEKEDGIQPTTPKTRRKKRQPKAA